MNNAKKILGKKWGIYGYMKYIISESRFDDIIMTFLDERFQGMEKHNDAIGGGMYTWWGIGNHGLLDLDYDSKGGYRVGVDHTIFEGLKGIFGLSLGETEDYIMRWLFENLDLKPLEIYLI
jgi:hypothetical protein